MATVFYLSVTPATGTVVINSVDEGKGVVRIEYDASDEVALPRAFALDITVDGGATIQSISDYKVGLSTADEPGYGIFPSSIQFDPATGDVIDWGSPVADPLLYPKDTQPGLGTAGITIEMCSLYLSRRDAPLVKDTLCRITIDLQGQAAANLNITGNIIRAGNDGGVVLETPSITPTVELVGCTVVPEPSVFLLLAAGAALLRRKR